MEFIYCGEVEIQNEGLVKFLEAANELQIEGLLQKGGVNKRSGMEKVLEISTEKEKLDLQTQQKDVLGIPIKDEPFFESKVPNSEEQEMLDEGLVYSYNYKYTQGAPESTMTRLLYGLKQCH